MGQQRPLQSDMSLNILRNQGPITKSLNSQCHWSFFNQFDIDTHLRTYKHPRLRLGLQNEDSPCSFDRSETSSILFSSNHSTLTGNSTFLLKKKVGEERETETEGVGLNPWFHQVRFSQFP